MHRLTLICHAATANQRRGAFPDDEPVVEGTSPAASMRAHLGRIDAALTSPHLAARQTAEALSLAAAVAPALSDINLGRWTTRSVAEVAAAEGEAVAQWLADDTVTPHGGESRAQLSTRVAAFLEARAALKGHTVAITHTAVIRTAVLIALEAPTLAFWRVDVEPLSLTDLRFDGRRWAVRSLGLSFGAGGHGQTAGHDL